MSGNQKIAIKTDFADLPEDLQNEECLEAYKYSRLWCLSIYVYEEEKQILEENLKAARELFENGDYFYANMPKELYKESCCRAFIFGLEQRLKEIEAGESGLSVFIKNISY